MPARKPASLNSRNTSKEIRQEREAGESAMTPKTVLSAAIPVRLRGKEHARAAATWKRTLNLYAEIEGQIVTAFDYDLLIKYCLLEEECYELESMRRAIKKDWESNTTFAKKIKPTTEDLKEWVAMWGIVNALFGRFKEMDARLDAKRKLLHTLSQSLYLTPRSRAGVAPQEREDAEPDDEMARLLEG
jgi:phage terminase small subunit